MLTGVHEDVVFSEPRVTASELSPVKPGGTTVALAWKSLTLCTFINRKDIHDVAT